MIGPCYQFGVRILASSQFKFPNGSEGGWTGGNEKCGYLTGLTFALRSHGDSRHAHTHEKKRNKNCHFDNTIETWATTLY